MDESVQDITSQVSSWAEFDTLDEGRRVACATCVLKVETTRGARRRHPGIERMRLTVMLNHSVDGITIDPYSLLEKQRIISGFIVS